MKRNILKVLALTCAVVLLCGMLSIVSFAGSVYSGSTGKIDMERNKLGTDVSCMTFNVLHYNGSSVQNYGGGKYSNRLNYAVNLIKTYTPDILGMQEAGDDYRYGVDWPTDLKSKLTDYSSIVLTDQTSQRDQMYITSALIIWYRSSRFTLQDSGCATYWSYATSCSTTSKDRWYQWAKLYDTKKNKTVYIFNTHLSTNHNSSGCGICSDGAAVGRTQRTNEMLKLGSKINSLAKNYPCFITGDFNCTMASSNSYASTNSAQKQLRALTDNYPYMQSALNTADMQVTSSGNDCIDHVFYNTNYLRCRKLVGIKETVGGMMGSDHYPYIAYCDYRPTNAKITSSTGTGTYDEKALTFVDTSTSNKYTFAVTPGTGFTYKIYKDTGVKVGDTIWSVMDTSKYEIRFYDPAGSLYTTVDVTIHGATAAKPTISTDGVNQYFSNHAYHAITDGTTLKVTLGTTGYNKAAIYSNAACTTAVSGNKITGIAGGRTTYYIKHSVYTSSGSFNFAEIYPLYVYKATATVPNAKTLYIDQNFGDLTGTLAYYDGRNVRLVDGQVNGFSTLVAAQPTINKADGYVVYMAPGVYAGNPTKSITKSVTIYGNNYGNNPNKRVLEGTWSMATRASETVITDQLLFSLYGNSTTTKTITIRGITFTGASKQGSIYVIENRGGTGSSYWEANSKYKVKVDIRNNIFLGYNTQSSAADINLNTASQKYGLICNNYFRVTAERSCSKDTTAYPKTYNRAIFARNINGLVIDSNRFVDYSKDFLFLTSEIGNGTTLPGYNAVTVQDNRFENCISTLNRICNVTSATKADVKYLGNVFIRCGYGTGAVYVDASEVAGTTNNYNYCDVTVMGNKFYECERSFGVYRSNASLNGYFNAMGIIFTQNAIHNPCERPMQPKNGYSSGCAASNYISSYQSYTYSPIYFRICNANKSKNGAASAWDLSHNYFYSARLACDYTNTNVPTLYLNSYTKDWTNGAVSAQYEGLNYTFGNKFFPYYVNHGCTNKATSTDTSTKATYSAVGSVTGITASGYSGKYDGSYHSISVTPPAGAFVSYSYNDSAATGYKTYYATNPTFKSSGTYTVYYRVIKTGCKATYGSKTVTLTK